MFFCVWYHYELFPYNVVIVALLKIAALLWQPQNRVLSIALFGHFAPLFAPMVSIASHLDSCVDLVSQESLLVPLRYSTRSFKLSYYCILNDFKVKHR